MAIIACDYPDPQDPRPVSPEIRQRHRDQGAFHIYEYVRRPTDPAYYDLSPRARARLRSAFLLATSAIDRDRLIREV